MSVFKRLKALFTGPKNDVVEDTSEDKVLNKKESSKTDLKPKQTNSNTNEEEISSAEKTESSKTSSKKEEVESESGEKVAEEELNDSKEDSEENSKNKEKKGDSMTLLNLEENKLTLDDVDPEFTQTFKNAGIDSVELCFQCGTCSGGCPSGRRTPYRVRQLVRKCLMGLKDEVISSDTLWMCTTCYTCQERCPREIKIVEIVKMARNIAALNGFMAPAHKATGSFVIKTGHGVPINDATMELRKRVGLGELPPTVHSFPDALEEVQKILEFTGFNDLIGYNKETGELE
jgi:heterodisulfide reductase subunit C